MKMHKIRLNSLLLSVIAILFFTPSFDALAGKVDVDMSFYGPERCGLSGVQTVRIRGVEEDQTGAPIRTDGPLPLLSVRTFDAETEFVKRTRNRFGNPVTQRLSPSENQAMKERISALTVANLTLKVFNRSISDLGTYDLLYNGSNFDNVSLVLKTHDASCDRDAHYKRVGPVGGRGSLNFCSNQLSTARLFDIVSHETGHALFDALNPEYFTTFTDATTLTEAESFAHPYRAVHESFGDLTALYTSCSAAILTEKDAELAAFFNDDSDDDGGFCIVSGWDGPGTCLRSPRAYSVAEGCEAHNHSIFLTSLMFNAMKETYSDLVEEYGYRHFSRPRVSLQYFQRLLICAAAKPPTFSTLGGFCDVLQETQYEMSETRIVCKDSFLRKPLSLYLTNEEMDFFYETAEENLNGLLERGFREAMDRCSR